MRRCVWRVELALCTACLLSACSQPDPRTAVEPDRLRDEARVRFEFHYGFDIEQVPANARRLRVWMPEPCSDAAQRAELVSLDAPVPALQTREAKHGNRLAYFECELPLDRPLAWDIRWRVTRRQVSGTAGSDAATDSVGHYLRPNRLVPSDDRIAALAYEASRGESTAQRKARRLYDFTLSYMRYSRHGVGWGQGDALWACDARYGNCSDYHSLFIAMCRASDIPARFEMGFPLDYSASDGVIGGYHCWAQFYDPDRGWLPVDVSEADKNPALNEYFFGRLHARRVHFTTGRDLVLEPAQDGPPVNFLVYPYVEIDGRPHSAIQTRFGYEGLVVLSDDTLTQR